MSLQIPCPNCGRRSVEEFVHGEVIDIPDHVIGDDARDIDRAFMRNNTRGTTTEAWYHLYGCRRWAYLRRDTDGDTFAN